MSDGSQEFVTEIRDRALKLAGAMESEDDRNRLAGAIVKVGLLASIKGTEQGTVTTDRLLKEAAVTAITAVTDLALLGLRSSPELVVGVEEDDLLFAARLIVADMLMKAGHRAFTALAESDRAEPVTEVLLAMQKRKAKGDSDV